MKSPLAIGAAVPRFDAYEKVTGKTKFAADYYAPNLVWAGVKRAGVPHAILRGIDAGGAMAVKGVLGVLTHADVGGTNRQGVVRKDQPVLVNDKIRHCGDAVALVLAEDKQSLQKALDCVCIHYDPLPAIFDPEEALKDGAPLIHDDVPEGNMLLQGHLTTGTGDSAESECDAIVEASFRTQWQEHAYLETEAGWARLDETNRLEIGCSTQTPFRDRSEVAEALGLEMDRVRIIAPYAGGAFGGKDGVTVQTLLGLAALHSSGRPVKICWNREESFTAGTKRHPARMHYKLGAKRDGTLVYLNVRLVLDTGPYDHLGGVVLALALEHAGGPYRIPNTYLRGLAVYTNNPIGGAFRGFGVTQVTAAMEQVVDMLAQKLGMDALELRLANALERGDKTCVGATLVSSSGLVDCLTTLRNHNLWRDCAQWKAAAGRFKRRGIGTAALMQASGYGPVVPDVANAKVELTPDGKIKVYCGVVDMGQGNAATAIQMAGSIMGQDRDTMEMVLPDTDQTLPSGSASASRCTYTFGNALIIAANGLRERILQRTADLLMARSRDELALIPGAVRHLPSGRTFSLAKLAGFLNEAERTAVGNFRAPIATDDIGVPDELRLHGMPHTLFSYGAHLACVEVDELTGAVDVKRYLSVTDCGNVVNPQVYEQQIQGGVAQGIGYALSEELVVDQGQILSKDLSTYILPTALDVPEIDSVALSQYELSGPFGLKGVGEIAMNGPLPAIANAVADACGIRAFESPLTPERIIHALAKGKQQEGTI